MAHSVLGAVPEWNECMSLPHPRQLDYFGLCH